MKRVVTRLKDMSELTRFFLIRGIQLGTLLHLGALVALSMAGSLSVDTYDLIEFGIKAQECGLAVYFVAVIGSAMIEERV